MAGEALTTLACPSCGAPIPVRAEGLSVTAVCPYCKTICDRDNEAFKIVQRASAKLDVKSAIELGHRGKIHGQTYEAIGFMRRFESAYPDEPWDEYLLYNPQGYAWLSESKGHWTLYKMTKNAPAQMLSSTYGFLGETYRAYHEGQATVSYVMGEFYWQVRRGDSVETLDAICPPHIISREKTKDETVWSIGSYIEPGEILAAFRPNPMPERIGIAPNQPQPFGQTKEIWSAWAIAVALLLLMQIFGASMRALAPLDGLQMPVGEGGVTDAEVTQFSTLHSSTHALIDVSTNLNQSWATVTLRIVPMDPAKTKSYTFEKDISYYSGYDSDGSWSEGSPSAEFLINGLPRGDYRVLASATPEKGKTFMLKTQVHLAPPVWANFWLGLFLLSIVPFWFGLRRNFFERRRWSDSEYNPYASKD